MRNNFIIIIYISLFFCSLSCNNENSEEYNLVINEYYESGELESQTTWVNGKKEGYRIVYYPSGDIKKLRNYSNDTIDGIYHNFFSNGKIEQVGKYVNGKFSGSNIAFFRNGQIDFVDQYYNGESYSFGEFDSLGRVITKEFFIVETSTPTVKLGDEFVCKIKVYNSYEFDKVKFWIADLFPTGAPKKKKGEVEIINNEVVYREKATKIGRNIFSGVVLGEKHQIFNIHGVIKDTTLNAIFPVYELYEVRP